MTPNEIRTSNLDYLNDKGFMPATWVPLPTEVGQPSETIGFSGGKLRPISEIVDRLFCLAAAFAWGSAPVEFESRISQFIVSNDLQKSMVDEELAIINLPKLEATEIHVNSVGWYLENMWSLAWVIGFAKEPSAIDGPIPNEVGSGLLDLFLPNFDVTQSALLAKAQPQGVESVVILEDRFYLSHNAVRSAQLGNKDTVPVGFDAMVAGGAIHERRHSLTWILSPNTGWDETDLST